VKAKIKARITKVSMDKNDMTRMITGWGSFSFTFIRLNQPLDESL